MKTEALHFSGNRAAKAIFPVAGDPIDEVITALGLLPYKAVIVLLGGNAAIDPKTGPRLTQMFGRGVARAATTAAAVVIDGAADAGIPAIMGAAIAGRKPRWPLIGVATAADVSLPGVTGGTTAPALALEPNHTHFVLVEGNGAPDRTSAMLDLVSALRIAEQSDDSKKPAKASPQSFNAEKATQTPSQKSASKKLPVVALLAGGAAESKGEVLAAVRLGFALILVEGSGRLADEIVAAKKKGDEIEDPAMAEIIAEGKIRVHQLANSVAGIERLIIREIGVDQVLSYAWETFAVYDLNANIQQARFNRLQFGILVLGVVGGAAAIFQQVYARLDGAGNPQILHYDELTNAADLGWWLLRHLLILFPIALTVLITAANRFKQGNKWLLLRAGAEAIKREIYRYRTRAMDYKLSAQQPPNPQQQGASQPARQSADAVGQASANTAQPKKAAPLPTPEQVLALRVEDITRRTMRTEVNQSALVPLDKKPQSATDAARGEDDGFTDLTPDRYVEVRLNHQLVYYRKKARWHEGVLRSLYWATFIIGGIGTYLAAINQQVWIAVTTSLVAAIGTYLAFRQTESTLTKYNQAATDLSNVRMWWNALPPEEQTRTVNIDSLVEHTEQVLQSELDGWVQQMQNALAELRKGQEKPTEPEEKKEPRELPAAAASTDTKSDQTASIPQAPSDASGVKSGSDAAGGRAAGGARDKRAKTDSGNPAEAPVQDSGRAPFSTAAGGGSLAPAGETGASGAGEAAKAGEAPAGELVESDVAETGGAAPASATGATGADTSKPH